MSARRGHDGEDPGRRLRAGRLLALVVVAVVLLVVLFTWVFPWIERSLSDPAVHGALWSRVAAAVPHPV